RPPGEYPMTGVTRPLPSWVLNLLGFGILIALVLAVFFWQLLDMDRELLYRRIDQRVDLMIEHGLLAEARNIYDRGYNRSLPAMQSIGYRQLLEVFDGKSTLEQAVEQIKLDTRHFAKRQLTWFRRDKRIRWSDASDFETIKKGLTQRSADLTMRWMDEKELFE
ncbi:MAG TPA: tRNA dimethylallyltransferase, partial [Clostridia bacterium]|nr:tRNA dimethylallyltransferase [Clostridia bacterium]